MALQLSPASEADFEEYARIHAAAFVEGMGSVLTTSAAPNPKSIASIVEAERKTIRKDPDVRYMKVTDTVTGKIISFSKWYAYTDGRTQEQVDKSLTIPDPPPDANIEAWNTFFSWLAEARKKYLGTRPAYFLAILITDPNHHRRGAGSLHLQWGVEQADKAGVESYLEASVPGKPLYERFGFRALETRVFDLSRYGGKGVDHNTAMRRLVAGGSG